MLLLPLPVTKALGVGTNQVVLLTGQNKSIAEEIQDIYPEPCLSVGFFCVFAFFFSRVTWTSAFVKTEKGYIRGTRYACQ